MLGSLIDTVSSFVQMHSSWFIVLALGVVAVLVYNLLRNFESRDEVKKFAFLGVMFCLIIGLYWALRPIKDSIFSATVGFDYQPYAKMVSLLVIVPLVILYSKAIDMFPRQKVFYALTITLGCLGLLFAWAFFNPVCGLANTQEDPTRILGWAWYVYVEVIGSLVVALFWAFVADTTMPEAAKRGYPLIALGGQLGNIFGPYFLRAERWGCAHSGPIVFVVAVFLLLMAGLMWLFMRVVPKSQLVGYHGKNEEKESEPGLFEGLRLVLTQSYLLGIFAIVMIYEIIVTVFDFYFKSLVKKQFPLEKDMANFLADYAVWTGIVAFLCVLFGINSIQRRLGMTTSLVMLPILVAGAVVALKFNPYLAAAFWIMVIAKAINYALNQPTLKQVYIPTTKDTKYKAAAWLEMFGSRGAKAGGSAINALQGVFKGNFGPVAGVSIFLTVSSGISLSLIVVWLFAAVFVAKKYNHAIERNEVVC